jgi:hypothetical protein
MSKKFIGRNDKCPCGSGKKYKNCCLNKDNSNTFYDDYISSIKDYGKPKLDKIFFDENQLEDKITAPRLTYSKLFYPELEKTVSEFTNKNMKRNSYEKKQIENTSNINELIDIMKKNPDILYHEMLKEKILSQKETSIPIILKNLYTATNDVYLELAVSIIYFSGINCSNELIDIIKFGNKRAYAISQLCMLLGFFENLSSEKLLWDYYHYFKEQYPQKSYSQCPLLGLIEIYNKKNRNKIDISLH